MKLSERLFLCLLRLLIIIDHISSYSSGKAIAEFLKIAFTPFIVIVSFGLIKLFESKKLNPVLFKASQEFMQVTGLMINSYLLLFFVAFSVIFYPFSSLTRLMSFLVKYISSLGFVLTAGLAGTIGGMIISDIVNSENSSSLGSILSFYFIILLFSLMFYCAPKIFSKSVRKQVDELPLKYRNILIFLFGVIILIFVTYGFINEPWL